MATAIGFSITAADQTSKAFESANKRIAEFEARTARSMSGVTKRMDAVQARFTATAARMSAFAGGAAKVAGGFREIARAGTDAYQRLGQVVPIIGALTSVATVAGIGRMSAAWAEWGQRIGNTSQRIGIAASRLSALQGAGALAGSSSDAMTSGLQGIGQAMYDAQGGRNTGAMVMMRTLQLTTAEMQSSESALMAVADRVQRMRNPYTQAQTLSALNIPEELLPAMRKGAAGIREYMAEAGRLNPVTASMIAGAERLQQAQNRVALATEGLRNRIAERLEPILTPMLNHLSRWISSSPAVARGIAFLGTEVEHLGHWLEGVDWDRAERRVEGFEEGVKSLVRTLGGPEAVITDLMKLMALSFAARVITPFVTLATRVAEATAATRGLAVAQGDLARAGVGAGLPGGGLGRGISGGLAAMNGFNLLFDLLSGREQSIAEQNINRPGSFLGPQVPAQPDTRHWWERFYKPGPGGDEWRGSAGG